MNANAPYIIARILGPFLLVSAAALFSQAGRLLGVVDAFLENDAAMMVAGFLSLLTGLVILTFAYSWRGLTEIIVTLLGWFSIARGLVSIFLPDAVHEAGVFMINNPIAFPIAGGLFGLMGLWLCFAGFFTAPVPEDERLVETL